MISTFSCNYDAPEQEQIISNCGEIKVFSVDNDYCRKMGLPEAEFTVKYPVDLIADPPIEGNQNYHYNYFLKLNNKEIQTETISLGYSTTQKNTLLKDKLSKQILNDIKPMLEQMGFELSDIFIGKKPFDGNNYYMLRARGNINNPENEFVGDYLIQCLIVEPDIDNENGVFVMMFANEESEIKSFDDFSNKGSISTLWKTLKFDY